MPPILFPASWYPHDLFRLQYATNTGAFLSLGSTLSDGMRFGLLTGLNMLILLILAWVIFFKRTLSISVAVALTLILSGGIGNIIDRLFREGKVVDFMNLGFGSAWWQRTGIFNVADLAIIGGLVLLMALEFFSKRDTDTDNATAEEGL